MAEKEWVERKALVEEIREAQRRIESCDDFKWERNKPYFKGLAWAHRIVLDAPAADVVPRAAYEQMKWERDVAMQQLSDAGIPFCGEMGGKRDEFFVRYLGKPVGECMCREKRVIQNGRDDSKEEEQ